MYGLGIMIVIHLWLHSQNGFLDNYLVVFVDLLLTSLC